jgi:hypothetical protein
MSAACHVNFEQTLIVALCVILFAAFVGLTLQQIAINVLGRKLDRVMRALKLDPARDDAELPAFLKRIFPNGN